MLEFGTGEADQAGRRVIERDCLEIATTWTPTAGINWHEPDFIEVEGPVVRIVRGVAFDSIVKDQCGSFDGASKLAVVPSNLTSTFTGR
jgi:hypothetical protein